MTIILHLRHSEPGDKMAFNHIVGLLLLAAGYVLWTLVHVSIAATFQIDKPTIIRYCETPSMPFPGHGMQSSLVFLAPSLPFRGNKSSITIAYIKSMAHSFALVRARCS